MNTVQAPIEQPTETEESLRNADRLWHLQKTGLTEGLSLREMHSLAAACQDRICGKNEVLFLEGYPADSLLLVNRGTIRLILRNTQGKEKIIGLFGTGDILGEEVLGSSPHRLAQAVAHEETWIAVVSKPNLDRLLAQIPRLGLNLLRILDQHLIQARSEIESLSFSDTEERIAKVLLKLSDEHGKNIVSADPFRKLKIMVSHEVLAQMIGGNRPHVSAIMSKFRKRGWIRYQKRRLLIDIEKISELVSSKSR